MGIPARARLGVDRSPDFTAVNRILSNAWDILVAEVNSEIIGFLDMRHMKLRIGAQVAPATYVGLAGIQERWRGTAAFLRLTRESEKLCRSLGSKLVITLVNIRNSRLSRFLELRHGACTHTERIVVSCILLGPHYRWNKRIDYGYATEKDLPEISQLISKSYDNYLIASQLEENRFANFPNFKLKNILLARDTAGQIVAVLGLWNQGEFRRTRILGYRFLDYCLRAFVSGLSNFIRFAPVPRPGENLNILNAIYAVAKEGHEEEFAGLLRHACNISANQGYHFLLLAAAENDPLSKACHGLWRMTNVNIPVIIPLDDKIEALIQKEAAKRVHIEYALI